MAMNEHFEGPKKPEKPKAADALAKKAKLEGWKEGLKPTDEEVELYSDGAGREICNKTSDALIDEIRRLFELVNKEATGNVDDVVQLAYPGLDLLKLNMYLDRVDRIRSYFDDPRNRDPRVSAVYGKQLLAMVKDLGVSSFVDDLRGKFLARLDEEKRHIELYKKLLGFAKSVTEQWDRLIEQRDKDFLKSERLGNQFGDRSIKVPSMNGKTISLVVRFMPGDMESYDAGATFIEIPREKMEDFAERTEDFDVFRFAGIEEFYIGDGSSPGKLYPKFFKNLLLRGKDYLEQSQERTNGTRATLKLLDHWKEELKK